MISVALKLAGASQIQDGVRKVVKDDQCDCAGDRGDSFNPSLELLEEAHTSPLHNPVGALLKGLFD